MKITAAHEVQSHLLYNVSDRLSAMYRQQENHDWLILSIVTYEYFEGQMLTHSGVELAACVLGHSRV